MGRFQKQSKTLILIFFVIVLVPLTQSIAFELNTPGNVTHPVRVNGGLPDSSVACNLTILDSHPNLNVNFESMSKTSSGNYFYYELNKTENSVVGTYNYEVTCISSNFNKTDSFVYYVNQGGIEPSTTKTDAISRTVYFTGAIGLILFIAFLFSKDKNPTYKYTYLILSFVFFLISTNIVFISLQDDVVNHSIQGFFSSFTAISFYMFWFLGFLLASLWVIAVINTIILKNNEKHARKLGDFGDDYYG